MCAKAEFCFTSSICQEVAGYDLKIFFHGTGFLRKACYCSLSKKVELDTAPDILYLKSKTN